MGRVDLGRRRRQWRRVEHLRQWRAGGDLVQCERRRKQLLRLLRRGLLRLLHRVRWTQVLQVRQELISTGRLRRRVWSI